MGLLSALGSVISSSVPIVGPLIAGGIGYAGQQSTNAANAKQAQQTNAFNAQQAELNREFQDKESSTSYQRGVADLKAAGLNPALAYSQAGASSPSGSTASGVTARFDSSAGAGISSAQRAAEFANDVATSAAQRDQIRASTAANVAQADLTAAQADNVRTLMAANLREIESRADSHSASAVRSRAEAASTTGLFEGRGKVLESEWLRNVASAAEARSRVSNNVIQGQLLNLALPQARANADAASSLFGHYVTPYLGGAKDVLHLFSGGANLFR